MMVLTLNDLEVMAEELKQCRGGPDSNPKGLDKSCRLKEHQLFAVDWMLKKEDQLTHGGILADDMGLGKTLELIALILKDKEMSSRSEIGDENDREEEEENPTLIVCPLSLMKQWYREISKFVQSKKLSFCEFYGPTNKISPADQESLTKHHDVVITNYQTLSVSPEGQTLFDIKWKRVILDEAHFIKNPDSEVSRAVCKLKAKHKWCVTGTPISNNLLDLYSLYKFLKLSDFDDKEVWENDFGSGTDLNNQILLHDLLRATMIRRSKVELGGQLCLPEKTETIIEIVLDDEEEVLYQRILVLVEDLVKERTAGQTRNRSGFGAILLKRQALAHPYLLAPNENVTINQTDVDDSPNINVDEESVPDEKLNKWWDGTKVDFVRILKQSVNSSIFHRDREPSKLRMLHKHLDLVLEQNDKAVIVSQWVNVIDLIKDSLEKRMISHQCITGAVKVKDRMKFCEEFNNPDSNCKVLLLQMQVGGCGLNLTGGNHLFVYDIHWNPQLLKQVYDRIYRIGQTKPVFIKMLITKTVDSIEEFILETQKKKLELADKVLSFNKMTPNDGWCLTQQVVEEITKLTSKEYGALVGLSKE